MIDTNPNKPSTRILNGLQHVSLVSWSLQQLYFLLLVQFFLGFGVKATRIWLFKVRNINNLHREFSFSFAGSVLSSNIIRQVQQWEKLLCYWRIWGRFRTLQWGPGVKPWKILFCVLNSSKHCGTGAWTVICLFLDESIFTLLRVWGSEFGIPNWYNNFKIALDMALAGLTWN